MRVWIERIKEEFRHQPLGAAYYVLTILGVIWIVVKGVFAYYNNIPPELAVHLNFLKSTIGAITVLIIPLLAYKIVNARNSPYVPALNPTLESLETSFELEVRKSGRTCVRKDKLKATSPTKTIIYRFRLTGVAQMKLELLQPTTAHIAGPIANHDYIIYQVELADAADKDQIVDICLKYDVNDPECTMRTYHSLNVSNLRKYRCVKQKLHFPTDQPREVISEICDSRTVGLVTEIHRLPKDDKGCYSIIYPELSRDHLYTISWNWE